MARRWRPRGSWSKAHFGRPQRPLRRWRSRSRFAPWRLGSRSSGFRSLDRLVAPPRRPHHGTRTRWAALLMASRSRPQNRPTPRRLWGPMVRHRRVHSARPEVRSRGREAPSSTRRGPSPPPSRALGIGRERERRAPAPGCRPVCARSPASRRPRARAPTRTADGPLGALSLRAHAPPRPSKGTPAARARGATPPVYTAAPTGLVRVSAPALECVRRSRHPAGPARAFPCTSVGHPGRGRRRARPPAPSFEASSGASWWTRWSSSSPCC